MKTIITTLIAFILFAHVANAQNDGRIKVTVLDEKNLPMVGAIVKITAGASAVGRGGASDLEGVVTFVGLTPGNYDLECRVTGYKRYIKTGIIVADGQTTYVEYPMQQGGDTLPPITVVEKRSPVDPTFSTIQNMDAITVKTMAADRGNVVGMVTGSNSQVSEGKGGQLVMRGSREGASAVYIDGEKTYGSYGVPALSISQVSVLSGGIPAAYGDLSGGAIIITTHSFWSGAAAHNNMYEEAAKKEAEEKRLEDEKSGKRVENKDEIIEKEELKGEEQPAPAVEEEKKEESKDEEKKEEEPKKEEAPKDEQPK